MATQESQYVETLSRILQVKDRIFLIYDYEESSQTLNDILQKGNETI